jgi:hypothetical protein
MKQCLFLALATALLSVNVYAITQSKLTATSNKLQTHTATRFTIDPVVFSVTLPKDKAWQKVVDLFVANSIPIKLMDKSSGLIQSETVGLGTHYTWAGADDSISWAFCAAIPNGEGAGFYLFPQIINAELQVYVREVDANNVLLSVNLMNLKAESHDAYGDNRREFEVQSAKRLEAQIGRYLMSNEKMPNLSFDPPFATYGEPPLQIKKRKALEQKATVGQSSKDEKTGIALLLIAVIAAIFVAAGGKNK